MPLFNQQTNLSGRGNAPSVTYYAGIKAPNAPDITLPKATGGFNIDLSRIGDAMIAAKESETKLGLAAVEMEQNLRNAERDRQLKINLATMEQDREDARQDKRLAMEWQKAQLSAATSLEKLKYQKQNAAKDQTKALANLSLSSDKELREKYIDYTNGKLNELEWNSILNDKINKIAVNTGANVQDLYTVANSIGYKQGFGSTMQANIDTEKTLRNQQLTQDISIGGVLSPQASESDKAAIGAEFREATQNTINMNRIIATSDSPMEVDMAKRILVNNQDKLIDTVMLRSMTDVYNQMRNTSNPVEFLEASKDYIAQDISSSTGSDYGQVRRRTDAMFKMYGVDNTLKDITTWAEDNKKFSENAYNTYLTQYKQGVIKDSPMLRAAVAFGSDFIKGLPLDRQEAFYSVMANNLIGNVQGNTQWTDENGDKHIGWKWSGQIGPTQTFENQYVSEIADELGMTPVGAVYYLAQEGIKNAPEALKNNRMMPQDGADLVDKTTRTLSGDPNQNLSNEGLSEDQTLKIQENVLRACESGVCTPEQIHQISEALPKGPQRDFVKDVEDTWSGAYKLGRYLGGRERSARFVQTMNYLNPDNLTKAEIKSMLGQKVSEEDANKWQLKNTIQWYTIKDGKVYIDYTQRGLITTGGKELQAKATFIRNVMTRAGLTPEEQVQQYKRYFPNLLSYDPGYGDSIVPDWMRDAYSILQQETIERGAKVDTQLASLLGKASRNISSAETITADEAYNMLKENTRVDEAIDEELNKLSQERIEQQGEEAKQKSIDNPDTVVEVSKVVQTSKGMNVVISGIKTVYINGERFVVPDGKSDEEILDDYRNGDLK